MVANITQLIKEQQKDLPRVKQKKEIMSFSISDTELILSLFLETSFNGKDVERAADTLGKIKKIYQNLLNTTESIT